ncbi:MAG: Gmad2 immunoglobulin-like domain-containing protein [Candidatus Brennerbacteria bacterium]
MNTKIIVGVVITLMVVGIAGSYLADTAPHDATRATFDPLNATYNIDGTRVTLVNGSASQPIAGESASMFEVQTFEAPERGDLDFDGDEDAALLLVVNSGGTGTFYYVVAAVNDNGTTKGTNAILLGDRIAPQTMEIKNGVVIANYADRAPDEPFTARPSVGVSKYLSVQGGVLVDVWPAAKRNLIEPTTLHPGDVISSPLTISGRARGNWYFEASFPVRLLDANGVNIPLTPPYITANSNWMTTEFVPFSAVLTFAQQPSGTHGTLIFQKDNPSGLPEHDDSLEFPVVF